MQKQQRVVRHEGQLKHKAMLEHFSVSNKKHNKTKKPSPSMQWKAVDK